jgi:hypothetical protein
LSEVSETNDFINQQLDNEDVDEMRVNPTPIIGSDAVFEEYSKGGIMFRKNSRYKIQYESPWKIHAATPLAESLGEKPILTVWSGDGIRLQDPLPPSILGPKWEGSAKNRIRFSLIKDVEIKLFVIYNHTHWGKKLTQLCNDPEHAGYKSWAKSLKRRNNAFLKGKSDPMTSMRQKEHYLVDPNLVREPKTRSDRLLEVLKTVDGIFLQRYLCYPEEMWTWDRYDLFTLGNLSYLLGDEFLDGELKIEALPIVTAYTQLKRARKWFKKSSHGGTLEQDLVEPQVEPWCLQFVNVWRRVLAAEGHRKVYLIGVLSQTRGCGTPPPLVVLQSKLKFLRTVAAEPVKTSLTMKNLRRTALEEIIRELPDNAFTGLATKARVTVTTSACWESTRKAGGTTEEIRRLINPGVAGVQYRKYDLDTGAIIGYIDPYNYDTVGELIFWAALDQVLRTPPQDLRSCFLTVVKEPGKARSVTKARACLKIVLDVVSKICAEPLAKGIRSSQSGMKASNHGWNVFCRLMSEEAKEEVFALEKRVETSFGGYVERTDTYKDLFVSSTDYEEATDRMQHELAAELAHAWMTKCGIPRMLRSIVMQTCYKERTVYFHATGMLATEGLPAPQYGENIRAVPLRTGVLMGDPLTKVCLHLTNVVTRHLGIRLFEQDFYERFPNGAEAAEAFKRAASKS